MLLLNCSNETNQTNQMKNDIVEKTTTNAKGGKQSEAYWFDTVFDFLMPKIYEVLRKGNEKYDRNPHEANWLLISPEEHIQHAQAHILRALAGGSYQPGENVCSDYTHAAIRLMFADCLVRDFDGYVEKFTPDLSKEEPAHNPSQLPKLSSYEVLLVHILKQFRTIAEWISEDTGYHWSDELSFAQMKPTQVLELAYIQVLRFQSGYSDWKLELSDAAFSVCVALWMLETQTDDNV